MHNLSSCRQKNGQLCEDCSALFAKILLRGIHGVTKVGVSKTVTAMDRHRIHGVQFTQEAWGD